MAESSNQASSAMLNRLRAAVLGANDGVVSVSSVAVGVAGASTNRHAIISAGLAALVAGALSMAVGEYVSVSSQSDAEKSYIEKERQSLQDNPDEEFEELTQAYVDRGVSRATAAKVAEELTAQDALKAHLQIEFNLDEEDISSPTHAAVASLLAFTVGGLVPFLTILFAPQRYGVIATFVSVAIALVATGYFSATVGGASRRRAILRVMIGGIVAMAVTYGVGLLFGVAVS